MVKGPTSPKQRAKKVRPFKYYAGFSPEFVDDVIERFKLDSGSAVLDPWVGAGTTVISACRAGHQGVGIDANPVPLIMAKAQYACLSKSAVTQVADRLGSGLGGGSGLEDDPLLTWFSFETAERIRCAETVLQDTFLGYNCSRQLYGSAAVEAFNPEAAFWYVALFCAVRSSLSAFGASNPTWLRKARETEHKIVLSAQQLRARLKQAALSMMKCLPAAPKNTLQPRLHLGVSTSIPSPPGAFDCAITSPPYCTRIDYIISTLPELAVLRFPVGTRPTVKQLRDSMLGTPTIHASSQSMTAVRSIDKLLKRVERHNSKAAKTYYHKWLRQYYADYSTSLGELARVLRSRGKACVVVQGSYFKDVFIDLARHTVDIAESYGLELTEQYAYEAKRNFGRVNRRSRYARSHDDAVEHVLLFQKE